tara:strand:- start:855 stop:1469 length:615 start_codon:yes stop_codon:yes gene_type:complete
MKPSTRYHHGDLRAAIIRSAMAALERDGPEGISLRGLAETVNVSRSAPYSHFRNKREVMAAIAEIGFDRLIDEMQRVDGDAPDARLCFLGVGAGYIRFALENPGLFKLMFSADLVSLRSVGDLDQRSARAYAVFRQSLDAFLLEIGRAAPASPTLQALAWSSVHGLAMLLLEDRLPGPPERPMDLAHAVTGMFVELIESSAQRA